MKLLFATNNEAKFHRFDKIKKYGVKIFSLKDFNNIHEVKEIGTTPIANAFLKAKNAYKVANIPTLGMDDSLYLEGVPDEKQPSLFVRRVNNKSLSDEEMLNYYIDLVNKYGINGKLNAKWIYGIVLIKDDKEYTLTYFKDDFYLTNKRSKKINSGYPLDSISVHKKLKKYFSEMNEKDKEDSSQNDDIVINFLIKHLLDN